MSHRRNIGDYTEEALAGYDLKLIGQVLYLPWAKIKGSRSLQHPLQSKIDDQHLN
jgi:hypothetical protein